MRPSLLERLIVAVFFCECKANRNMARDDSRRRTGVVTSTIQTTATPMHLELFATPTPTHIQLPTSVSTGSDCSTTLQRPTTTCLLSNGEEICTPTTTPIAFCKSDYLCFKDDAGQGTCRPRDNKIAPAGIAFAITVPLVLAIITTSLIILRRRERRVLERQRLIRTMERDALDYAGSEAVLPRFEKYQRPGFRRHDSMRSEHELQMGEGDEEHPPPAYDTRNFESGLGQ